VIDGRTDDAVQIQARAPATIDRDVVDREV